ncbi:Hypothetical protein R9X50_00467600 [Acrodontium crateriforme]|uniref:NACHT domain-containing protein n=1 Tax=Acrodontium crateriforme TaxID=150365 RepID=A0AAQ3M6H9_9PEZI|nr:Hypothetical protein R9X50_00467600 [Acrodontium crateriforme]
MSTPSTPRDRSFRRRLHDRLLRLRSVSPASSVRPRSASVTASQPSYNSSPASSVQPQPDIAESLDSSCIGDTITACTGELEGTPIQSLPSATCEFDADQEFRTQCTSDDDIETESDSQDVWSAAFREAVNSLGTDIDVAILQGRNIEQILRKLEQMDEDATQTSGFKRGIKYLHSIQIPLEGFKLALDLASPFAGLDPTAKAVFGVVTGVTAIAISFATADLEFAKQIGEMLSQLSYIDDCDTLGQKTNKSDIHKALVSMYGKILEFYKASFEILSAKGVKLVLKMALEQNRLPAIVQEFLKHAEMLHKIVQNVTAEIALDIRKMLYDQEIARWLGGDKIGRQSEHHADLGDLRDDRACEFLLENPRFTEWYRAPKARLLAITGNMGSGKSVAAAFLVDELMKRRKSIVPRPMIIYHYCRDDETGRTTYVLSVLILSLLEQLSGLKKNFYDWYKDNQASGNIEPAKDVRKLEEFFQLTVQSLERSLFIVIDGLDECDRTSRIRLLRLLQKSAESNKRLKILVCSRPNEEILQRFDDLARIDLISDSHRDRMIVEHTVKLQLMYLPQNVKELVIDHLSSMAQGSAIWTKMVVKLIEERQIRALGPMKHFLGKIPLSGQLSILYDDLLSRCTSNVPDNQNLAKSALSLLAASSRPLSRTELAWAAALATAPPDVKSIAALSELVDEERLIGLVRPFVATFKSDEIKNDRFRLVHQSVKEYVIENFTSDVFGPEDAAIENLCGRTFVDQSKLRLEAFMLRICIRYLLLDDIDKIDLLSEEQAAIEELPQEVDLFNDYPDPVDYNPQCTWEEWEKTMIRYDPTQRGFGEFFVYASCYWLDHFAAVDKECLPNLQSVEVLCAAGSTRLYNWTQQNSRPGCVLKARFEFDSRLYDALGVTSLYGPPAMLYHMMQNSDFSSNKFLPSTAISATKQILQWGELERLSILVSSEAFGCQLRGIDFWSLVLDFWSDPVQRGRNWEVVFNLIDNTSDTLVDESSANELLCLAARVGCLPLIQRLMIKAQHDQRLKNGLLCTFPRTLNPLAQRKSRNQPIGEAVLNDHVATVDFLLKQRGFEEHLTYTNAEGENVLHLAAVRCNPVMFSLLMPYFPKGKHNPADQGDSALVRVILSSTTPCNRFESARILLQQNAASGDNHTWNEGQNPLCVAVRIGDIEMCSLLIRTGNIDPQSAITHGCNGRKVLIEETPENAESGPAILQMLMHEVEK